MNSQKIQDHAEHCDFYVGNEHYDKSYEEQQRLWVEKFAELIVRECIDICLRNHINNIETISAGECAYDIQEHFGVD